MNKMMKIRILIKKLSNLDINNTFIMPMNGPDIFKKWSEKSINISDMISAGAFDVAQASIA